MRWDLDVNNMTGSVWPQISHWWQDHGWLKKLLKSMSVNKDVPMWHLIAWHLCCQLIGCQVPWSKWILTWELLIKPDPKIKQRDVHTPNCAHSSPFVMCGVPRYRQISPTFFRMISLVLGSVMLSSYPPIILFHNIDVMMGAMASQITSLTIVY